jgi:hypothetical protein
MTDNRDRTSTARRFPGRRWIRRIGWWTLVVVCAVIGASAISNFMED